MTQTLELKAGSELVIKAIAESRGYEALDLKERSQLNRKLRYASAAYTRAYQPKPAYRA